MAEAGFWSGQSWQDYCLRLFHARYLGHELQIVPDRDRGDLGIEAFTRDGCVFQCYAAEEPLSIDDLYEKQRDKLSKDVAKLKKYAPDLEKLLGSVTVNRYIFMVPRFDSRRLIVYAQQKSEEVKEWSLPFIEGGFYINIETDSYYEKEKNIVWKIPDPILSVAAPSQDEIVTWKSDNPSFVATAERKLSGIDPDYARMNDYLSTLLDEYIVGNDIMNELRNASPDAWSEIVRIRTSREKRLALEHPPETIQKKTDIMAVIRELEEGFAEVLPSLPQETMRSVSWSTIADWIYRCPLDIESVS